MVESNKVDLLKVPLHLALKRDSRSTRVMVLTQYAGCLLYDSAAFQALRLNKRSNFQSEVPERGPRVLCPATF